MSRAVILLLRGYQRWVSPLLGNHCRFTPSCSQYAIDAIKARGVVVGGCYTVWRLLRCHPFCKGGYDPAPGRHDVQDRT